MYYKKNSTNNTTLFGELELPIKVMIGFIVCRWCLEFIGLSKLQKLLLADKFTLQQTSQAGYN